MIKKILLVLLLTFGFIFKSSFALESSWDGIKEAKLRIISPLNNTNMTNSIDRDNTSNAAPAQAEIL